MSPLLRLLHPVNRDMLCWLKDTANQPPIYLLGNEKPIKQARYRSPAANHTIQVDLDSVSSALNKSSLGLGLPAVASISGLCGPVFEEVKGCVNVDC